MLVFDVAMRRASGACLTALWVATVGAAELNHESINHSMEVQTIIEAGLGQIDEVLAR